MRKRAYTKGLLAAAAFFLIVLYVVGEAVAQEVRMDQQGSSEDVTIVRHATVQSLKDWPDATDGILAQTLGFHAPGDGGGALYRIRPLPEGLEPNGADVIALENDLVAILLEREAVNYWMFGAVGDGENDDGVQIKLAHEYANTHGIPVVNRSGEFWIRETNQIPIQTNVRWGKTRFHIDEEFNTRRNPRFEVLNDRPTETIELDDELKAALLERLGPGVQIIPELAPYAGHLVTVRDDQDRIGIRAGYENHRGWAREEFFYVEQEGRIIGDIAWEFDDLTSVTATPCNDVYLVIEGGGFHVSGENPNTGSTGYHYNGFSIRRSRTIIREQWVGLETGASDDSLAARHGFYSLRGVYDVTLENIRLMPWEKSRRDDDDLAPVPHGTYGIGGSRMLNCTFRNVTAEAGWVSWGVFGTNLNKNFRIENCRLNRVDVHFHCHNLYIEDSVIGFKGISVTGGGDLFVEDTTRYGNSFINFRRDYGSKWDGRIRLRGCTLKPVSNSTVSVLSYRMANFDYQYPIGFARSVSIDDLVIDYSGAPESESPCWLMNIVPFSQIEAGGRLFFPGRVLLQDIRVRGRQQGVRLVRIPNPEHYHLRRAGGYDGSRLTANCTMNVERVQLEQLTPQDPGDTDAVHLLIGAEEMEDYADELALYPKIHFSDCEGVSVSLGNSIAGVHFERCSLNTVTATGGLRGELKFADCKFQANLREAQDDIYAVDSALGTRFTNCIVHAPVINGEARPDLVDRTGLLEINGPVRHHHLNTALGNRILDHCRDEGVELEPDFIDRLKLQHSL